MKKLTALIAINVTIFLCSCSNSVKDTYFVHSIGFETYKEEIKITAVLEKLSKDNQDYFIASSSASSIDSAAKKLMSRYEDCYFATCDIYFIPYDIENSTVSSIAEDICDSNIFPTTSSILCVKDNSIKDFLSQIKKIEDIRQIKKEASKNTVNTATFFARFYSDSTISIDTVSFKDGSLKKIGKTDFNKTEKAVFNE